MKKGEEELEYVDVKMNNTQYSALVLGKGENYKKIINFMV